MKELLHGAAGWLLPLNLIPFAMMGIDKRRAAMGARRIPERVLLLWALPFSAAGATLGMLLFRHKTRKPKFALGLPLLLLAQLFILWLLAGKPGWQ